jgi:hypothetical protein
VLAPSRLREEPAKGANGKADGPVLPEQPNTT